MEPEENLLEVLRNVREHVITGREVDHFGDPNMFCVRLTRSDITLLVGLLAERVSME